jgi:hypothetical protein
MNRISGHGDEKKKKKNEDVSDWLKESERETLSSMCHAYD